VDGAEARKVRAETLAAARPAPLPYRLEGGRPAPWRPRDLDWTTLASALGVPAGTESPR
jgi:hypothetical protein